MGQEIINTFLGWQRPVSVPVLASGLLASCPFCGEATGLADHPDWSGKTWVISCLGCEASSPPARSEAEAIARWNSRVRA